MIPRAVQQELAREWMRSLDAFIPDVPGGVEANRAVDWLTLASMWSLRISANRVGLSPVLTRYCETNHNGNRIWPDPQHPDASLIHYCYGDVDFDKRNFPALDPRARRNLPRSPVGTFNAILRDSIDEALETFGY